jgi:hypothetical protein
MSIYHRHRSVVIGIARAMNRRSGAIARLSWW